MGKAFADFAEVFDIATGFDFDLDALVAGGEFLVDDAEEVVDRVLDAEGDAGGYYSDRGA